MLFYLFANCFSALSGVVNKFFIKQGYYDIGVQLIDVTFHANLYNLILYFMLYFNLKRDNMINFSIKKTFYGSKELLQILLFAVPIYASAYKLLMFERMPISYVEISSMIKPLIVFFLAIILLKERFYSIYILYLFIAIIGFCISNYEKIFFSQSTGLNSDLIKILYYIVIASIGDITRRYYCRKWDNAMQSIFIEMFIFGLYGFLYLSIFRGFSLSVFLSPYTYVYSSLALLHHICIINGVQKAPSVAALELLNFSKNIFSLIFSALILKEETRSWQALGAIIIGISLYCFNIKRKRQDNKNNNNIENNV